MKKLFVCSIIFMLTYTTLHAQTLTTGGFRRAGTNAQTKAMQRQKLQDSLGLTSDQSMKVDAIQQNFGLKIRALKLDTNIGEAERKSKLLELQAQRMGKLKEVISNQQIAKMEGRKAKAKKHHHLRKIKQ